MFYERGGWTVIIGGHNCVDDREWVRADGETRRLAQQENAYLFKLLSTARIKRGRRKEKMTRSRRQLYTGGDYKEVTKTVVAVVYNKKTVPNRRKHSYGMK